jgi:hypothetical protein
MFSKGNMYSRRGVSNQVNFGPDYVRDPQISGYISTHYSDNDRSEKKTPSGFHVSLHAEKSDGTYGALFLHLNGAQLNDSTKAVELQALVRDFANDVRNLEAFRDDNPGAAVSDAPLGNHPGDLSVPLAFSQT